MLCSEPLMDGPHRLTRRQALRLGAGAAALGALRLPSPALAAGTAPALFELALPDAPAHASSAAWRATHVLQAPHRFDLAGLRWTRAARFEAQIRTRTHGGRWTRWTPLPASHGTLDGTDPVYTGAADELQLRTRGSARGLRARFVKTAPQARPAARAAQAGDAPGDRPARELGRRPGAAALGAELRHRPGRVRAPHGHRGRLRAGGIGRDRPRHRPLPPRLQRLERHRLQLPRRPLRRDLRGPRGRRRSGRDRRPGAGLEQRLDRHRLPRDVHQHPARRARDGDAGQADRLEALAARRARPGPGDARVRRRREQPLPGGRAGRASSASAATATAARPPARASSSTRSCPTCAPAPPATATRSPRSRSRPPARRAPSRRTSPASCASPTAPRPAGATLGVEYTAAGSAWTQVTTTACGLDGSWATSVQLPASGQVRAVFAGDATRTAARIGPGDASRSSRACR